MKTASARGRRGKAGGVCGLRIHPFCAPHQSLTPLNSFRDHPSPTLGRQSARLAGPGAQPRRRDEVAVTAVKNVTIGLRCKDIEAERPTPRGARIPHSALKATMPRGPKGASRGGSWEHAQKQPWPHRAPGRRAPRPGSARNRETAAAGASGTPLTGTSRDRAMLGAVCPVSQRKPLKSLLENGAGLTCFHAERFGERER